MRKRFFSVVLAVVALSPISQSQQKELVPKSEESSMTYTLVHPLHKVEATSKGVQYHVQADPVTREIKSVSASVDVMTFDSGNSSRDSHAMEVIDAISYPEASFSSTSVARNGDSIEVAGRLTFHGVTKDIVLGAMTKWSQGRLEVDGGFEVSLTAFNIERPALLLIPVEDRLTFSFAAVFEIESLTTR